MQTTCCFSMESTGAPLPTAGSLELLRSYSRNRPSCAWVPWSWGYSGASRIRGYTQTCPENVWTILVGPQPPGKSECSPHSRLQSFARPPPWIAKGDEQVIRQADRQPPWTASLPLAKKTIIFNQLHIVNRSWSSVSQEKYTFNHPH